MKSRPYLVAPTELTFGNLLTKIYSCVSLASVLGSLWNKGRSVNVKEKNDNLKPEHEYQPPNSQPGVVNVYNTNVASSSSVAATGGALVGGRNQSAFIVGFITGVFGLWGVAHFMNGKIGSGILWLIFGPILAGIAITVFSTITLGIGLILAIPLWLLMVYAQAKSGAKL